MRLLARSTMFLAIAPAALLAISSTLHAGTKTITVVGEYKMHSGFQPGTTAACQNVMFVRWAHVANVTNARLRMGTAQDDDKRTKTDEPPFDNHYVISASANWTIDVEPGYDWIHVGGNGGFSFNPNATVDCGPNATNLQNYYLTEFPVLLVDLTIAVEDAAILTYRGGARLDRAGRAPIARVQCPVGASCSLNVPRNTAVKIGRKRYPSRVLAPKIVGGGRTSAVKVKLGAGARRALGSKSARVRVTISANRDGSIVSRTCSRVVRNR